MTKKKEIPPTIITLTLPTPEDGGIAPERTTATLLIQRGELAHVRQFHYNGMIADLTNAIRDSFEALAEVESNPPVIPETTPAAPAKAAPKVEPQEPTIEIPLKKGSIEVKISHLKIVGGETDAAAYRQAVLIAAKLIDGKLWDGKSPIRIDNVYTIQSKLKPLTDKELSLFMLTDFVQTGEVVEPTIAEQNTADKAPLEDSGEVVSETPVTIVTPSNQQALF